MRNHNSVNSSCDRLHDVTNSEFRIYHPEITPEEILRGKGHAPNKVQHLSSCEISVNVKYLANPFGIKYKLNGFELGAMHPFQIRRVCILYQKGWRDIDTAHRQLFSISLCLIRSMTLSRYSLSGTSVGSNWATPPGLWAATLRALYRLRCLP